MIQLRGETTAAIQAVQRALITAGEGTGAVRFKVGRDVVTDTDEAIEDALRDELYRAFGYPVIGEERGGTAGKDEPHWLLDPICGTRNFASGLPLYAVNLAFVEDGDVAIGVVGDGGSQCIHVAQRGEGAFTIENGNVRQIHASAASKVVDFEGFPPQGSARDRAANVVARIIALDTLDVRCLSSTLSLAYVAEGRIACTVLFAAPSVVHIAAGALLAAEAGALVVDVDARPWTTTATSLVAAADAATLEQVLKILDDGSDPSN